VEVVLGEEPEDVHRGFVEDLVEVITSFAKKLYGVRSHKGKSSWGLQGAPRESGEC